MLRQCLASWLRYVNNDCVYMLEHNRVMNVSNEDWILVNRFIRSASPKGSSQDWISEIDRIAGLESVLVGYLPTKMYAAVASSNSSYAIVVCMPPDSLLLLLRCREPEVARVPLV